MVTTSKIRSILAMTSDIYNEVIMQQNDKLSDDLAGRIEYLRIRVVYEVEMTMKIRTLLLWT